MLDDMFDRKHGSRPGVAHICILITDGRSSKPDLTEEVAEEAHDSGIYVFAIGKLIPTISAFSSAFFCFEIVL